MATKKTVKRKPPAGDRMRFLRGKAAAGTATESEYRELEKLLAKNADATGGDSLDAQTAFADDPPQGAESRNPAVGGVEPTADVAPGSAPDASDTTPPPVEGATVKVAPPPRAPPVHRLKAFFGKVPSPEKPPRMERESTARKESDSIGGDWRRPYEEAAKGAGREATVLFFASRWLGGLKAMSDSLKTVGVDPMVDVDSAELKGVLVLTVDDYLPAHIQVKPVHQAAFASSALLVQTFMHRKEIVAETKKAKERGDQRKNREAAEEAAKHAQEHNRTVVEPPPEPPPPAPPVVPHPASVALARELGLPLVVADTPVIKSEYKGPTAINPDEPF